MLSGGAQRSGFMDIHPAMCLTTNQTLMEVLTIISKATAFRAVPVTTLEPTIVGLIGED